MNFLNVLQDKIFPFFIIIIIIFDFYILGDMTIRAPGVNNNNEIIARSPLALFWNKNLGFQFQITDGDVNHNGDWAEATINSV